MPIDSSFSLDASNSYDENDGSSSGINYMWSCSYLSFDKYTESCDSIFGSTALNTSTLLVADNVLNSSDTYSISVVVWVESVTRSGTTAVTVTPTGSGAPSITITSDLTSFNAGSDFVLFASL